MKEPTFINENLSLWENDGSLAFGTDAYLLAAYLKSEPKSVACELGAGSSVVSLLAMARHKYAHVTAIEIQPEIAALARRNVEKNGFLGKIDVVTADIREYREQIGQFHSVFANPPYLRTDAGKINENDADAASRHECFGGIADFAQAAGRLLRHGGRFTVVYRPDRLSDLFAACRDAHLEPKRITFVYPTTRHAPCTVLAEAKKGAASGLYVTPPLVIYREPGEQRIECYTQEMNDIYENGAFYDSYHKP